MDSGDNRPSATFNLVVNIASLKKGSVYSLPCKIRNIPWQLLARKEKDSNDSATLGIYLMCTAEENGSDCICQRFWNCSATYKIILLNKNANDNVVRELDYVFRASDGYGNPSFIKWDTLTDPDEGYMIDKNTIFIRAEVVVSDPVGIKFKTKDDYTKSELFESKKKIQFLESEVARLNGDLNVEKCNVLHLQNDLANEKAELQVLKNHVANEKAELQRLKNNVAKEKPELQVLKNNLANEKAELELLKKNAASAETEFQVLKNDLANEKAELQRLKNDIANEKIDTQSKLKILETLVTNSVLQISELKKAKESPAQNASPSTNSLTEDLRSEVRDVLLSLLSSK